MSLIKELIKAPIESKLYNEYYTGLEYSHFSYNDFALTRESAIVGSFKLTEEQAKSRITMVEYRQIDESACCEKCDLSAVNTEYILFVSEISGISKGACQAIASYFDENENSFVVYGDEDELNSNGTVRMNPWFKPGWSPDTLLDYFYIGNAVAVRTEAIKSLSGYKNIYELVLMLAIKLNQKSIAHIDYVLYHTHYLKKLFAESEYKNIKSTYSELMSNRDKADVMVSIVIPSKDNPNILKKCITSVLKHTKGVFFEIIVIDNGSNEENKCKIEGMLEELKQDLVSCEYVENHVDKIVLKYLYKPQPFNFSRMCNQGAKEATGDFILFLNDDIEVREANWLKKMISVALRKHSGAVGAKLYYPESMMIQHTGITNIRLGPVHKLQFKDDNAHYYMDQNNGVRNCLAVTGACLLVDKEKFNEIGGFCEELEVAFNDVDLCFRLYECGYHNAVCNNTHLWHHESFSRGQDTDKEKLIRLAEERKLLYERHPNLYATDPYYSDCMSTDILDTNYSFIYEYDYRDVVQEPEIKPFKRTIKDSWYNECLMVSLEYVGNMSEFDNIVDKADDYSLISGYAFVAGSDNALFSRSLILHGDKNSYIVETIPVYRPDLEVNLDPEEYALMSGFCVKIDHAKLPAGEYRVGVLAKSGSSRLKLYQLSNKYIKVNTK